jgi:hypothetical protein
MTFNFISLPKSSQNFRQIKAGAFDLLSRCFDHRRATYVHTFLDIFRVFTGSKALTAFSLCALWPLLGDAAPRQPRQRLMEQGLARGSLPKQPRSVTLERKLLCAILGDWEASSVPGASLATKRKQTIAI